MSLLEERIRHALSPLIGLQLWGAHRALNMEMFSFASKRKHANRKGHEVEVGDYELHVQCPWRVTGPDGIVAASGDRRYPADEDADWESFDEEKDLARLEARMESWLEQYQACPLRVEEIHCDYVGGFELLLCGVARVR